MRAHGSLAPSAPTQRGRAPVLALALALLGLGACRGAAQQPAPPGAAPAKRAYVANTAEGTVSIVDVEAGVEVNKVRIPPAGARFAYPSFLAASADGGKVYVANLNTASVSVIDTATDTITTKIELDHPPRDMALTPDGKKLYVAGDGQVAYVIDTTTDTLGATVPLGDASFDVAIAPDGRRAYVTVAAGTIAVVDVTTDTVVENIVDLRGAAGLTIDRTGKTAYVLRNDHPGRIYVVELDRGTVVAEIPVDDSPITAALSPDGNWLYVVNRGSGTLSIVDTQARREVTALAVGAVPSSIAISRDGKFLYIAAAGSNAVYVVSTDTRTVAKKIKLERTAAPRPSGIVLIER